MSCLKALIHCATVQLQTKHGTPSGGLQAWREGKRTRGNASGRAAWNLVYRFRACFKIQAGFLVLVVVLVLVLENGPKFEDDDEDDYDYDSSTTFLKLVLTDYRLRITSPTSPSSASASGPPHSEPIPQNVRAVA